MIFKVFGMTQPGIEPMSPGPLANTLPTRPIYTYGNAIANEDFPRRGYCMLKKYICICLCVRVCLCVPLSLSLSLSFPQISLPLCIYIYIYMWGVYDNESNPDIY